MSSLTPVCSSSVPPLISTRSVRVALSYPAARRFPALNRFISIAAPRSTQLEGRDAEHALERDRRRVAGIHPRGAEHLAHPVLLGEGHRGGVGIRHVQIDGLAVVTLG